MAVFRKADGVNQIPQIWAADLYSQAENLTFWGRFEGPEGSSMPVIRKDDLEKGPGDTIKFDIVLALAGAGQTGDTTLLDGNEEKMVFSQQTMTVASLQHAVRWSKLAKILIDHDLRTTGRNQLAKWLAGKQDDAIFTAFTAPTLPTTAKWYAGTANSIATVADTDPAGRLKLNDISDVKAYAMAQTKIEPLRMDNGEEVYGMVLHPYTALSLKKDSQFQQAQRDAQNRGSDNPLFTGAIGMWDGVVLYVANRVPTANDGVTGTTVARNIFFGAQALCRGYAYYPDWTEQEFSYGQEIGIATFLVKGEKVNVFDLSAAQDASALTAIGSLIVYAAAAAPVA